MSSIRLACEAMATRFEFILCGVNESQLRAAGDEAFQEIHRLEAALSLYRPSSEIAEANRNAFHRPVRITPEVFQLLRHALLLSQATDGAFDITAAPLLRAWGLMGGSGRVPSPDELAAARASVGPGLIKLDESDLTVRFLHPGVTLDLGAIGKGYALDRAAECLREAGIENALLQGGTSSAIAMGRPPENIANAWRIAIGQPASTPDANFTAPPGSDDAPLAVVELHDESFAVSAVWGKGFTANGRFHGHVLDPRTGRPVESVLLAAIALPSATESDAISTALLVRGAEMLERLRGPDSPGRCLVLERADTPTGYRAVSNGISIRVV